MTLSPILIIAIILGLAILATAGWAISISIPKNNVVQNNLELLKFVYARNPKSRALNNSSYPDKLTNIQCPGGVCGILGKGYDLRQLNIKSPENFPPGKEIFLNSALNITNNNKCFQYNPINKLSTSENTTSTVSELVSNMSNQTTGSLGLPIDFATFRATADATVKQSISVNTDLKTASIDIKNEDGSIEFLDSGDCRTKNINPLLLYDFMNLPVTVDQPNNNISWSAYTSFFQKWGTHVATKIIFGSKIEIWESIISNDTSITKYLGAKACLDANITIPTLAKAANMKFYGTTTQDCPCATTPKPDVNINFCNNYTSDDLSKAKNLNSNSNLIVMGGNKDARNKLYNKKVGTASQEDILAFLSSSSDSNQGIGFVFEPLWKLISLILLSKCYNGENKYCDTNNTLTQRLINMEASYIFNTIDCRKKTTTNNIVYQDFVGLKVGNITKYKCWAGKEGCRTSDDCRYNWGKAGCISYGPSALQQGELYPFSQNPTPQYKTTIKLQDDGKGLFDGINKSCKGPVPCKCTSYDGLPDRYIWEQI